MLLCFAWTLIDRLAHGPVKVKMSETVNGFKINYDEMKSGQV